MSGRQDKERRIRAALEGPGRYRLDIPAGASGVQVDAEDFDRAQTIDIAISGAESAKARDLLRAMAPRLRPEAMVGLTLHGVTEHLLHREFAALVVALEGFGYAAIDVLYEPDAILLALRHAPTLDAPEMTVWLQHGSEEASLTFATPRDLLRRMALVSRRFYEAELLEHIASLHRGAVVVDAGANIGNHTVFLARFARATVHAFEPEPAAFACLEANVRVNAVAARVQCRPVALGAAAGRGRMVMTQDGNLGASRFEADPAASVAMSTLDAELAGAGRIDVIKVDVEGMEEEVLRGGAGLLERWHPDLFVECLDAARLVELTGWLTGFGYRRLASHTANPTWEFSVRR